MAVGLAHLRAVGRWPVAAGLGPGPPATLLTLLPLGRDAVAREGVVTELVHWVSAGTLLGLSAPSPRQQCQEGGLVPKAQLCLREGGRRQGGHWVEAHLAAAERALQPLPSGPILIPRGPPGKSLATPLGDLTWL